MWWAAFEIIKSLVASIVTSRLGQIALIVLATWFWSAHNTALKYEAIMAAEKAAVEAAYKEEMVRQQYAAREIAEAATRRAEDDAATAKEMQTIIDEYANKKPEIINEKGDACVIDDDFARVVQRLGEASIRHPRAARRSVRVR